MFPKSTLINEVVNPLKELLQHRVLMIHRFRTSKHTMAGQSNVSMYCINVMRIMGQ